MNDKVIKVIGVVAMVGGAAASLASNWVNDKKLDNKISEAVAKAVSEKE